MSHFHTLRKPIAPVCAAALFALAGGCQGSSSGMPIDSGATADMAQAAAPDLAVPPPPQLSFQYTPAWSGVTSVSVIGAFGQATDWTQPFMNLTADANGNYSGTATVPAGTYTYLFVVTGDSDAAVPATIRRESLDPSNPSYVACPAASPTYSATVANPCSQIVVGAQPSPTYHVTGSVTYDGRPIGGYLVVIEREEAGSHHFFANRTDTKADGSFDLPVAAGQWRIQVEHPTLEKLSDADRAAQVGTLQAMRRAISGSFPVGAAVAVTPVEMANHLYNMMTPAAGATTTLPVSLQFVRVPAAATATADVYGLATAAAKSIGDPWYASPVGTATTVSFDGTFNTAQKGVPTAVKGDTYYWGTEQHVAAPPSGNSWDLQSLVLPLIFK